MKYRKYIDLSYFTFSYAMLFIARYFSDLPISIGNASKKAIEIINFEVPSDNFYPIGKSILLIPFLWNGPNYVIALLFYFTMGVIFYYLICNEIKNEKYRLLALLALPLNPYLVWLIYTSQDTAYEFALLTMLVFVTIRNRYWFIILSGLLLSLTRPGYWPFFIFCIVYFGFKTRRNLSKKILILVTTLALSLAPLTLLINYKLFGKAEFADESGMTAYFSYHKNLYLALPLFDMDVFLSKNGHGFNNENTSSDYTRMALQSITENPKQVALATLEKFDAYVFDIQKVPHLPGEYALSADARSIEIGNERLSWILVLGNVMFAIYRTILISLVFLTFGAHLLMRRFRFKLRMEGPFWLLITPWLAGLIPGIIFYTETRFKIVSELLLAPFVASFWQATKNSDSKAGGNLPTYE